MSNKEDKQEKYITYTIIASISILMIASLIALVICSFSLYICKKDLGISLFNLSTCFVGTSASLLVYIAFREQVKTNKETFKRLEKQEKETEIEKRRNEEHKTFDRLNFLIVDIKSLFENFTYIQKQPFGANEYKNVIVNETDAFREFEYTVAENLSTPQKIISLVPTLRSLKNILINIDFITSEIITFNPNDENMKSIIRMKFQNIFQHYSDYFKDLQHDFTVIIQNSEYQHFSTSLMECLKLIDIINERFKEIEIQ